MGQQLQQRVDVEGPAGSASLNDLAVIYDPATKKFMTAAELNARQKAGGSLPTADDFVGPINQTGNVGPREQAQLGFTGPGGQFAGLSMDAGALGDVNAKVYEALPQIAGLIAQFIPALRGAKASFMIPAVVDAIEQKLQGEDFDLESALGHGALGLGAHGVGAGVGAVGNMGKSLVTKALDLPGAGFANRTAEELLPKLAIREGAEMTIPGVDKVAGKAAATGSGGLQDLADALEHARMKSSLGPLGGGGGIMAAVRDIFSPPRQLAAGQAMAEPFGVSTAETIAPTAEAGVRALMAWLSSQVPQQTQRRPLPR